MVLREGVDVKLIGKAASLPPDISPIQIGARGKFGESGFDVLGRVRLQWNLGAWNEWFIQFDDGAKGWLAEAQGFYMVSREKPASQLPPGQEFTVGRSVSIGGMIMTVADVKEAKVAASEGELPFAAVPGRQSTTVDLTGPNSAFASIEVSGDEMRYFAGRYCHFSKLSLTNLRPVPGWFGNPPIAHETGIQALNCPKCNAAVSLKAPGQSVTVSCPSCGTILDVADNRVGVIHGAVEKLNIQPAIPLGTRANLFGVEYEAIGFMQRADGPYTWFEYLLFNPHHGYTWLVNYEGHWNYVERLLETPDSTLSQTTCDGVEYTLFLRGTAKVRYVVGEFYWRVEFNEKAQTADYIAPPYMLSSEYYPDLHEVTWSRGLYMEPDAIAQIFGVKDRLREPVGVYMNQPNPWKSKGGSLGWTTALLLAILLAIQVFSVVRARNEVVADRTFTYVAGGSNTIPAIEFEVKGGQQPVAITSVAPSLDNSWMEIAYELQGIQNGERRHFVEGLEYYYGSDWSEGRRKKTSVIPAVAPGKYRLLVEAAADPQIPQANYYVHVRTDVPVWRNFLICLALLLAYPLYRFARSRSFEHQRWAQSDYDTSGQLIVEDDEE